MRIPWKTVAAAALVAISLIPEVRAEDTGGTSGERTGFILPVMLYTTDTGFGGGFALIKSYNLERARPSYFQGIAMYTAKKQTNTALQWEHYLSRQRDLVNAEIQYAKFPTNFYTLGNSTDGDIYEKYTPESFGFNFYYERTLYSSLKSRFGILLQNQALITSEDAGMVEHPSVPWYRGRLDAGPTLGILWDDRDSTFGTKSGTFAQLSYFGMLYQNEGGAFNTLKLDLRTFYSPVDRVTFAFQVRSTHVAGDAPFYHYPTLGGQDLLRGYETDRYRDRNAFAVQHDTRFHIWGPLDGAVFAAAGRVDSDVESLLDGEFHAAGGGGLRYYFNRGERLLIRLDYAVGDDATGVYITFGEAY